MSNPASGPADPCREAAAEHALLAASMARGDEQALGRAYDLLGGPLYSLALRITDDANEAQEVVQDVFLHLWQRASDYQPARGSYFAWAATLTRNRALDRVRLHGRRTGIVRDSAGDAQPSAADDQHGSGVAPPPGLRASILAAAGRRPPADSRAPFSWVRVLPWVAAACLAFSTGWFALQFISLRAANRSLAIQRELAEIAHRMAQSQLAERTLVAEQLIADLGRRLQGAGGLDRLRIISLASPQPDRAGLRAIVVWDQNLQTGLLAVEKLPQIAADQDYQIWVIDPQYPLPVDGGLFRPGDDGRATVIFTADKPIAAANAFAISLERRGGVPQAEGPIVLQGGQ